MIKCERCRMVLDEEYPNQPFIGGYRCDDEEACERRCEENKKKEMKMAAGAGAEIIQYLVRK